MGRRLEASVLEYQPAAFRPTAPSPALGLESRFLGQVPLAPRHLTPVPAAPPVPHPEAAPRNLGKERANLGQQFDQLLGWNPVFGDLLRLTFHSATGYLGVWVGLRERGFMRGFGWVLGIGNGLAAVADIISLVQRAIGTHPPEGKAAPAPAPKT